MICTTPNLMLTVKLVLYNIHSLNVKNFFSDQSKTKGILKQGNNEHIYKPCKIVFHVHDMHAYIHILGKHKDT